jgi:uncharacterized damage-inducible protein DinB
MTLADLRTLVDYHYWARDRLLAALAPLTAEQYTRDMGNSFRSLRDTAVHVYSAEWAWLQRWQGSSPSAQLSPDLFPTVDRLRAAWTTQESALRGFLDAQGESGVTREIDYTMLTGAHGRSVFWHMLQHVVNHASYHRGQITTLLRQVGAAPAESMDLIRFYRDRT